MDFRNLALGAVAASALTAFGARANVFDLTVNNPAEMVDLHFVTGADLGGGVYPVLSIRQIGIGYLQGEQVVADSAPDTSYGSPSNRVFYPGPGSQPMFDLSGTTVDFNSVLDGSYVDALNLVNDVVAFGSSNVFQAQKSFCDPATIACAANTGAVLTAFVTGSTGAVPEPTSWALMLVGFGLAGIGLRHSRRKTAFVSA